ncbi:hypothetical protein CYMTET_56488 [Cymbomonas tetramitiformis]|uniref:Uncharacterized protein n=1 Tax=Cymbomonas tetramitiformis TaxID=36881 RepID=A0AAE0BB63_9CHLO|nr:hypothetical protein CYMTET_56488 [Cymbomonas tetramitiformis]
MEAAMTRAMLLRGLPLLVCLVASKASQAQSAIFDDMYNQFDCMGNKDKHDYPDSSYGRKSYGGSYQPKDKYLDHSSMQYEHEDGYYPKAPPPDHPSTCGKVVTPEDSFYGQLSYPYFAQAWTEWVYGLQDNITHPLVDQTGIECNRHNTGPANVFLAGGAFGSVDNSE